MGAPTIPSDVLALVATAKPERRKLDAELLLPLFAEWTGEDPVRVGTMIGFGSYHYRYLSGREGDSFAAGFSPRRAALTIYLQDGVHRHADDLAHLGPHTSSVSCLYVKDVTKLDLGILEAVVRRSYRTLTAGVFTDRAGDVGSSPGS